MDKLWRKHGLDLKMVTFSCVPTGPRRGFVELVNSAETLRKIQVRDGFSFFFKRFLFLVEFLLFGNRCVDSFSNLSLMSDGHSRSNTD